MHAFKLEQFCLSLPRGETLQRSKVKFATVMQRFSFFSLSNFISIAAQKYVGLYTVKMPVYARPLNKWKTRHKISVYMRKFFYSVERVKIRIFIDKSGFINPYYTVIGIMVALSPVESEHLIRPLIHADDPAI